MLAAQRVVSPAESVPHAVCSDAAYSVQDTVSLAIDSKNNVAGLTARSKDIDAQDTCRSNRLTKYNYALSAALQAALTDDVLRSDKTAPNQPPRGRHCSVAESWGRVS